LKDIGEADVTIVIKIVRAIDSLSLTQSYYFEKVIKRYDHEDQKPISTPYDPYLKLRENIRCNSQLEYATVIGILMYVMHYSRPNVALAIGAKQIYLQSR
jgi:precorrin-2 methylase